MDADLEALPDDVEALKTALLTARARERKVVADRNALAAELAVAKAMRSEDLALIAHQKLRIAKLEREVYGHSVGSIGGVDRPDELTFEEAETTATVDELAAETAVAKTT